MAVYKLEKPVVVSDENTGIYTLETLNLSLVLGGGSVQKVQDVEGIRSYIPDTTQKFIYLSNGYKIVLPADTVDDILSKL